jgi:hypothetical protein
MEEGRTQLLLADLLRQAQVEAKVGPRSGVAWRQTLALETLLLLALLLPLLPLLLPLPLLLLLLLLPPLLWWQQQLLQQPVPWLSPAA